MRRLLILHCGPMKTGSTFIQDTLKFHHQALLEAGISYYHIRAKSLQSDLEKTISKEELIGNKVVLLSSEFFCQKNSFLLRKALSGFSGECHAILTSRPLREVYPSLYLQNLKGSSKRITSFRYFLERQVEIDLMVPGNIGGQLMNAPALDARLTEAGCQTHWIRYDRDVLLNSFFRCLEKITGIPLGHLSEASLAEPLGLSPRRSFRMEFAGIARVVNCLNRLNVIPDSLRERLFVAMLDMSGYINRAFGVRSPLTRYQCQRCDKVDRLANQAFLNQFWGCPIEE